MLYFLRCVIASAPPLLVCFPAVSFLMSQNNNSGKVCNSANSAFNSPNVNKE